MSGRFCHRLLDQLTPPDCTACGEPILGEDHTPHDVGCDGDGCLCSNRTHPACCWDCSPAAEAGRCPHCSMGQVVLITTEQRRWSFEQLEDYRVWSFAWQSTGDPTISTKIECQRCRVEVDWKDAGIDGVEWGGVIPVPS